MPNGRPLKAVLLASAGLLMAGLARCEPKAPAPEQRGEVVELMERFLGQAQRLWDLQAEALEYQAEYSRLLGRAGERTEAEPSRSRKRDLRDGYSRRLEAAMDLAGRQDRLAREIWNKVGQAWSLESPPDDGPLRLSISLHERLPEERLSLLDAEEQAGLRLRFASVGAATFRSGETVLGPDLFVLRDKARRPTRARYPEVVAAVLEHELSKAKELAFDASLDPPAAEDGDKLELHAYLDEFAWSKELGSSASYLAYLHRAVGRRVERLKSRYGFWSTPEEGSALLEFERGETGKLKTLGRRLESEKFEDWYELRRKRGLGPEAGDR